MQIIFLGCGLTSIVDYQKISYGSTQCIAFLSAQSPFRVEHVNKSYVEERFYQSLQISTKHMTEYFTEERHLLSLVSKPQHNARCNSLILPAIFQSRVRISLSIFKLQLYATLETLIKTRKGCKKYVKNKNREVVRQRNGMKRVASVLLIQNLGM